MTRDDVGAASWRPGVCPVCRGTNTRLYMDGHAHALEHAAFGSSRTVLSCGRILRCADCGFGFTETRPTADQLRLLYTELDLTVYESEARGRMRNAERHLKILRRFAPQPGRILDIGCASGRFLLVCADAGWTAAGLEPSQVLCQKAREMLKNRAQLLENTLEESTFAESSFDAVTMWDVLEHVPWPGEFLQRAVSLLKPGGFLLVNVPNLDSLPARLLGRRWPLFLPEHLNYFNRKSLELCGVQSGVELLDMGARPVSFSTRYVAYRVAQHVPYVAPLSRFWSRLPIANLVMPVWMGEVYAVWTKPVTAKSDTTQNASGDDANLLPQPCVTQEREQ